MQKGQMIGDRYQVIGLIGKGGMATVYKAYDAILEREVAIKVMRTDLKDDPMVQQRFDNEIRSSAELIHPNITQVYDYGEEQGTQYLVSEYVAGSDLKRYELNHHPIPLTKVVTIVDQILAGIRQAHERHIVHRDLKPQNILMTPDGVAKITDFGIARAQASNGMTRTDTAIGSVHYMSPEQVTGKVATNRSDLYAIGIMLYELLTGEVPFAGDTSVSIAVKHTTDPVPSVREKNPRIPQALENVVLKATAKNVADRYPNAQAMQADLATALDPERLNEAPWGPAADQRTTAIPVVPAPPAADVTPVVTTPQPRLKLQQKLKPKKRRSQLLVLAVMLLSLMGLGVYGAAQAPQYSVPDVRDKTQKEATELLQNGHFKIRQVTEEFSDSVKKGRVVGTTPNHGTLLGKDGTVDLIISKGMQESRFGSYLNDLASTAIRTLRSKGYMVSVEYLSGTSVPNGYIIGQSVDPEKKVIPSETHVVLTVSRGSGQPQPEAPSRPAPKPQKQSSSAAKPSTPPAVKPEAEVTPPSDSGSQTPSTPNEETSKPDAPSAKPEAEAKPEAPSTAQTVTNEH